MVVSVKRAGSKSPTEGGPPHLLTSLEVFRAEERVEDEGRGGGGEGTTEKRRMERREEGDSWRMRQRSWRDRGGDESVSLERRGGCSVSSCCSSSLRLTNDLPAEPHFGVTSF